MSTRVDGGKRSLPGGANLQETSTSTSSLSLSPCAKLLRWRDFFPGYNILRGKPLRAESTNAIHVLPISSVEIALWALSAPSFVHSCNLSYLIFVTGATGGGRVNYFWPV